MTEQNKLAEIWDELRLVLGGRSSLLDSLIPPIAFAILNALLGLDYAVGLSIALALIIAFVRLRRGQSFLFALGGLAGVGVAVLVVRLLGRAEGFFLPGIVTGALTLLLALLSLVVRRPLVAWTSLIARRWPGAWYWHPQVRPAYGEVTWLWVFYFSARLLLQIVLFQTESATALAVANVVTSWPTMILLLVLSYLYGTWRLRNLGGPSVEEFKSGAPPPWESQRRGF